MERGSAIDDVAEAQLGVDERVLLDDSPTVATARAAGVMHALSALPTPWPAASRCWVLSTDADSVVPPTSVADLLLVLAWSCGARAAYEGRSPLSASGGGTPGGVLVSEMRDTEPEGRVISG